MTTRGSDAAQIVRDNFHAGDLIVFAPRWVDPVGRLHLGDLIPVPVAGRMDDARFARVWELSIRGAHAIDGTPIYERTGEVTVRRFEQTPVHVLADVRDRAAEVHVQRVLAEVGFAPHDCIQVAVRPGAPTRVTFPQLTLGTSLVGYVGIPDAFDRRDYRDPATLEVDIDGQPATSATAGVEDGWVRFDTRTSPGKADVTFVATTTGKPNQTRKVCFAAEARE